MLPIPFAAFSFFYPPSLSLPVFLSDEELHEEIDDLLSFFGWQLLQVFHDSIHEDLGSPCMFLCFLRFSG